MRKKMLLRKKAVVGSLLVITILISSVTALPITHKSCVTENKSYFGENIVNFDESFFNSVENLINYLHTMIQNAQESTNVNLNKKINHFVNQKAQTSSFDLAKIDKSCMLENISSLASDQKEEIKNLIVNVDEVIKNQNGNKKNIDSFYFYQLVFQVQKYIQLNQPTSVWLHLIVPLIFILYFGTFILLDIAGITETSLITAVFIALLPSSYVLSVFTLGWWLTWNGVEIILNIENPEGEPLNDLNVTAVPWDASADEYDFTLVESEEIPGLYSIPNRHIDEIDVPPGIFDFTIYNGEEYYLFDNSLNPIYNTEKFMKTIIIE